MKNSSRKNAEAPYTDAFYAGQSDRSYQSAGYVLPLVLAVVPAKSAIDVGCGVGTWAFRLLEYGVSEVTGVDGDYVNRELLRIPQNCFQACDLGEPIKMDKRFDLAMCLEVAEHLPPGRANSLIEDLVKLAPVVLFSAAIPGQGGTSHINERYLTYWASLFRAQDYVLLDILRPSLWNEEKCDWWYRQNAVLFAHKDNALSGLHTGSALDYVHPHLLELKREECETAYRPTLGSLLRSFPSSFSRSFHARTTRLLER